MTSKKHSLQCTVHFVFFFANVQNLETFFLSFINVQNNQLSSIFFVKFLQKSCHKKEFCVSNDFYTHSCLRFLPSGTKVDRRRIYYENSSVNDPLTE